MSRAALQCLKSGTCPAGHKADVIAVLIIAVLITVALNPARCLGTNSRKGTLRPGADADLIFLIAAVMSSASGSGERRSGRKSKRFYVWL